MGWRRFFSRHRGDVDRADELQQHFDLLVDDHMSCGLSRDEAARRARLVLGNPRVKREEIDDMNRLPILDTLSRDARYAIRVLRRSPAFTITSVLTLALVIGGNTAVMSLADAMLLQPLPYPHPEQLARVLTTRRMPGFGETVRTSQDGTSWEVLRDRTQSVDVALLAGGFGGGVNVVVGNAATTANHARISAGYFRVLGVLPQIGREFTREEDRVTGAPVAIVSHRFWQRQLNGDARMVGQRLQLRGEPHTIVGVMPVTFVNPGPPVDVWTPARPSRTGEGLGTNYMVMARVKDGSSWTQASAELSSLGRAAFQARGNLPSGMEAWWTPVPFQDTLSDATRIPIQMLGMAGAVVLLIACVNIAALLLARAGTRAKEIATRMALGSGRAAVMRQLVVESIMLGLLGGAAGVLTGHFCLEGLKALGGDTFWQWSAVTLNARVFAATAALSVLTSLLFGLLPAIQAGRMNVNQGLAFGGSRSVAGTSTPWLRRGLVVAEVALGVVLLVAAGLLVRTYANLRNLDPGFNPTNVMTATVSLQDSRYATSVRINHLFDASLEELRRTPGIVSAAVSLELPYRRLLNSGFRFIEDPTSAFSMANVMYVTPGYLRTLEIPLEAGRELSSDDRPGRPPVVLVNETFVRSWAKGVNPVGRRIWIDDAEREIVGVVGDVQLTNTGIDFPGRIAGPLMTSPQVLVPAAQTSDSSMRMMHTWFQPVWTIRTRQPMTVTPIVLGAIGHVDPQLPVQDIQSLADIQAAATSPQRLMMTLVGGLAALALLLASVGIYGLIAHGVIERQREFGIRLALGATTAGTIRRLTAAGVCTAAVGAVIGVGLAWMAVSAFDSFAVLFHVDKHDPATFAVVAIALIIVATIASIVPALRILRLDPATILRE